MTATLEALEGIMRRFHAGVKAPTARVKGYRKYDDKVLPALLGEGERKSGNLGDLLRSPLSQAQDILQRQAALADVCDTQTGRKNYGAGTVIGSLPWKIKSREEQQDGPTRRVYEFGWEHDISQAYGAQEPGEKARQCSSIVGSMRRALTESRDVPLRESKVQSPFLQLLFQTLIEIGEALPVYDWKQKQPIPDAERIAGTALGNIKAVMEHLEVLSVFAFILENSARIMQAEPSIQWTMPEVVESGHPFIAIEGGTHPILNCAWRMQWGWSGGKKPPQPVSISLGQGENLGAVITGPNEYGKTTLLKMIALIVTLAQIGAPVPAKKVVISPFRQLLFFSSQGNEDLRRGLSGFSGEIAQYEGVWEALSPGTLWLSDEMGATTDPNVGRPLMLSTIAEKLIPKRARFAFSTHFRQGLAEFEQAHPAARMLHVGRGFDPNTQRQDKDHGLDPGVFKDTYSLAVARRHFPLSVIEAIGNYS